MSISYRQLLFIAAFLFIGCHAGVEHVRLASFSCATKKDGEINGFRAVDDGLLIGSDATNATGAMTLFGFQTNKKEDLSFKVFAPTSSSCLSSVNNFVVSGRFCELGALETETESANCPDGGGAGNGCNSRSVTCQIKTVKKVAELPDGRVFKVDLGNLTEVTRLCAKWKAYFTNVRQVMESGGGGEPCVIGDSADGFPVWLIVLIVVVVICVLGAAVAGVAMFMVRRRSAEAEGGDAPADPIGTFTSKADKTDEMDNIPASKDDDTAPAASMGGMKMSYAAMGASTAPGKSMV
ncbi:hypothetical protein niasHS_011182 [Heterodera schachtii]|uniref:Uncharacterized protein n=1 Tax=Heterodera schachtii TaxID=97005 RepID=A0ABD2J0D5_HETSC